MGKFNLEYLNDTPLNFGAKSNEGVKDGGSVPHFVPETNTGEKFRIITYVVIASAIAGFLVGFATKDTYVQDNLNEIESSKKEIASINLEIQKMEKKIEKEQKDIDLAKNKLASRKITVQ